jgi:nicotinate-nucleotide pyrophosphorylase (carboxylating)
LISKDTGVLAGIDLFSRVFTTVDSTTQVEAPLRDGADLVPGDLVAVVSGRATSVLAAERTALNFVSYLSGIATQTRRYVDAAGGRIRILDTRKTLPGYRELAKYAVVVGGGENHRMGLHDMVMIKDNHIDMAGSVSFAVERVRRRWGNRYKIEVECRTPDEVGEALEAGVDVVMLDNMTIEDMLASLALPHGKTEFEISGNVNLQRITALRDLGADSVSVGALTHTVVGFDFSLITPSGAPDSADV